MENKLLVGQLQTLKEEYAEKCGSGKKVHNLL